MGLHRTTGIAAIALVAALLSGCASPGSPGGADASAAPDSPGSGSSGNDSAGFGSVPPGLPDGEVVAQGTVLDAGDGAQLCLGGIMESLPPQCTGIPLVGWSWDGLDGAETASATTWGAYAVQGTYDGEDFTVTSPPLSLALYDPAMPDDPTGGEPGPADEATLLDVQEDIHAQLGAQALSSWPQNGRLWVQVVWDDGTLQDAADARYGDDVVIVQSALREIG